MANENHKEVGHGMDGAYRLTIGVLIGLLLVVAGVGLIAYFQTTYSLVFGVPLLLLGLVVPILLQLVLGGKGGR